MSCAFDVNLTSATIEENEANRAEWRREGITRHFVNLRRIIGGDKQSKRGARASIAPSSVGLSYGTWRMDVLCVGIDHNFDSL